MDFGFNNIDNTDGSTIDTTFHQFSKHNKEEILPINGDISRNRNF